MPPACPPCSLVWPGRVTPAPSAPAAASRQPAITGVPAARPVSAAARAVTPPTISEQAHSGGSFSSGTPTRAAAAASQRWPAMSKK